MSDTDSESSDQQQQEIQCLKFTVDENNKYFIDKFYQTITLTKFISSIQELESQSKLYNDITLNQFEISLQSTKIDEKFLHIIQDIIYRNNVLILQVNYYLQEKCDDTLKLFQNFEWDISKSIQKYIKIRSDFHCEFSSEKFSGFIYQNFKLRDDQNLQIYFAIDEQGKSEQVVEFYTSLSQYLDNINCDIYTLCLIDQNQLTSLQIENKIFQQLQQVKNLQKIQQLIIQMEYYNISHQYSQFLGKFQNCQFMQLDNNGYIDIKSQQILLKQLQNLQKLERLQIKNINDSQEQKKDNDLQNKFPLLQGLVTLPALKELKHDDSSNMTNEQTEILYKGSQNLEKLHFFRDSIIEDKVNEKFYRGLLKCKKMKNLRIAIQQDGKQNILSEEHFIGILDTIKKMPELEDLEFWVDFKEELSDRIAEKMIECLRTTQNNQCLSNRSNAGFLLTNFQNIQNHAKIIETLMDENLSPKSFPFLFNTEAMGTPYRYIVLIAIYKAYYISKIILYSTIQGASKFKLTRHSYKFLFQNLKNTILKTVLEFIDLAIGEQLEEWASGQISQQGDRSESDTEPEANEEENSQQQDFNQQEVESQSGGQHE